MSITTHPSTSTPLAHSQYTASASGSPSHHLLQALGADVVGDNVLAGAEAGVEAELQECAGTPAMRPSYGFAHILYRWGQLQTACAIDLRLVCSEQHMSAAQLPHGPCRSLRPKTCKKQAPHMNQAIWAESEITHSVIYLDRTAVCKFRSST